MGILYLHDKVSLLARDKDIIKKTINIIVIIASWISNYEINYCFLFKEIEMYVLITQSTLKFGLIN